MALGCREWNCGNSRKIKEILDIFGRWSSLQLGIHFPRTAVTCGPLAVGDRVWIPDYSNNTPTDNLNFVQSKKTWPMIGNQLTFHVLSAEGDIKELFSIPSGKQIVLNMPTNILRVVQTQAIFFLKSMSERDGSDMQRL